MTLLVTIQGDLARPPRRARRNRLTEKGHRSSNSALRLEERLDGRSLLFDRAVHVASLGSRADVGFIHPPG
jgi:hypothetical protein